MWGFICAFLAPSPVRKLSVFSVFLFFAGRTDVLTGKGGGTSPNQPYDRKKVWSSINHSVLSVSGITDTHSEAGVSVPEFSRRQA
jgi:hypothetical protein